MKVLITGGAGYIGTELIYRLVNQPEVEQVIIYDNLNRGNYNLFIGKSKLVAEKLKFVQGEILDTRKLKKHLDGVDIVYHLAAKVTTPFADQSPHEFDQVNHWGTAELIYTLEESDVKKLIYLSSVSVYGASSKEIDINTVPNPKTFYGISKLRGEDQVKRLFDSKIKTYIVRCGNVYGYSKSMRFDSVINKFMFEANYNGLVRIYGNGNQSRSFIHIDRLSDSLINLLDSDLEPSVYNMVESTFSINDIVDVLKDMYPDLEMLFVNQNLKLRELKIKFDERVAPLADFRKNSLREDLETFKKEFTY